MSGRSPTPQAPDDRVVVRVHGTTDVGLTREHNEDAFLVADLELGSQVDFTDGSHVLSLGAHGLLFVVADGMGGAASGELASSMATTELLEELRGRWRASPPTIGLFAELLRDAAVAANRKINEHAREHAEHRGMGTTLTAAGLLHDHLYLIQVGDSRAYLVRDGIAQQITKDQSLMQRLIDAGEMTPEEAEVSERRNIILQALGPEASVTVDLTQQQIRRGDVLVLCSDGLSGQVRPHEIAAIAGETPNVRVICERLVALANDRGGPDNVTVVTARFEGGGLDRVHGSDRVGYTAFPLRGTLHEMLTPPTGSVVVGYRTSGGMPAVQRATPARSQVFLEMERSRTPGSSPMVGKRASAADEAPGPMRTVLFWLTLVAFGGGAVAAWIYFR